jgi:hypothetical protein
MWKVESDLILSEQLTIQVVKQNLQMGHSCSIEQDFYYDIYCISQCCLVKRMIVKQREKSLKGKE